uniref:Germin-like protein n=1 Tax=Davidia involucrata TaxID=16924 RepID=A0A5B7B948_DAVIN
MMKHSSFLLCIVLSSCFLISCINLFCLAVDPDNLQDTCPTAPLTKQSIFINGFPCKDPSTTIASDFKTSILNHAGDTDNFLHSITTIVTAADLPGLNTLGLSVARTDIELDGLVMPHSHPRASEMLFVTKGVVVAGFIDTKNRVFQKVLKEGDVFVVPRGLLHYALNAGFEFATVFSVLNSHNPGVVSISDAMFAGDSAAIQMLMRRLISLSSTMEVDGVENVTLNYWF